MIELHLIGYTADLEHLVLELTTGEGTGRYRLVIEPDLFATLDDVRRQRRQEGLPVGDVVEFADRIGLDRDALADVLAASGAGPVDAEDGDAGGSGGTGDPDAVDPAVGSAAAPARRDSHGSTAPAEDDPAIRVFAAPSPWQRPGQGDHGTDGAGGAAGTESPAARDGQPDGAGPPGTGSEDSGSDVPATDPPGAETRGTGIPGRGTAEPGVPAADVPPWPVAPESPERDGLGPETEVGGGPEADPAPEATEQATGEQEQETAAAPEPVASRLTPAEIQAELRAGRSARAVAREAETDLAWVERWLRPIQAERTRVLERARQLSMDGADPAGGAPLGATVRRNLARRSGVDEGSMSWRVARRDDGAWSVTVRYRKRGRGRQATWTYDPGAGSIRAASPKARELGVRGGRGG